jgi:Domain of unknown function (DUF4386)
MTHKTNSRIAGFTFLLYIAIGITSMILFSQVISGAEDTVAKLANIAQHRSLVGVNILLTLLSATCAIVLAVTLYALTRDQDRDLAMMALCCRVSEGVIIFAISPLITLGLKSVAMMSSSATDSRFATANVIGTLLLKMDGLFPIIPATSFAVGSSIFSYLFLRARSIPLSLGWLGVVSSIMLVIAIPLQLAGFITGSVTGYIWMLMFLFEVPFALWLLIKGVKNNTQTNELKIVNDTLSYNS